MGNFLTLLPQVFAAIEAATTLADAIAAANAARKVAQRMADTGTEMTPDERATLMAIIDGRMDKLMRDDI